MTVAGSDSGGGAGVQADMLSFAANGVFATSAVAALTAQNPSGVRGIFAPPPEFLTAQMEAVWEYFRPSAAKCGMLFSAPIVGAAADFFERRREIALVVDPVMVSTSGAELLSPDAAAALMERLAPLARLVTPNLDEARRMLGCPKISAGDMPQRAVQLAEKLGTSVLLKGGHAEGGDILTDILASPEGGLAQFRSPRVEGIDSHGSGCTLSAAVCARLALGEGLAAAVANARAYLASGMAEPVAAGGERFINHFPNCKPRRLQ